MYREQNTLRLSRKYDKLKDAIAQDDQRGFAYLQKQRKAGVA